MASGAQNAIFVFSGLATLFFLVSVSDAIVAQLIPALSDRSEIATLESRLASAKAAKRRSAILASREVSLEALLLFRYSKCRFCVFGDFCILTSLFYV